MKFRFLLVTLIPLIMLAEVSYGQTIYNKDFGDKVDNVRQEYPFWCVYACLEALENIDEQCDYCFNFSNTYLAIHYFKRHNPYYPTVSNSHFMQTMKGLVEGDISPCWEAEDFRGFGALLSDFNSFVGPTVDREDFEKMLTGQPTDLNSPPIGVSAASGSTEGTGHAVVFVSSMIYGTVSDSRSWVSVMDPDQGQEVQMSYRDFITKYKSLYIEQ